MLSVAGTLDLVVRAREMAEERNFRGVIALLSLTSTEHLSLEPELGHLLAQAYSQTDQASSCNRLLDQLELCCAHHGNDRHYRRRLNLRAVGAMREGNLSKAESLLCLVAEASLDAADDTFLATAMMNLGVIADMRCAWDQAGSHYRRALVLFQRLGNRASMAGCYHNLGMLSRQLRQMDEAEQYYRRALENYKNSGTPEERISTGMEQALLASDMGDADRGAAIADRCLRTARILDNRRLIGEALRVSGLVKLCLGQVRGAYNDFCAGLRVERSHPNPMLRAELHDALGGLLLAHSISGIAIELKASAVAIYEGLGLIERANAARV